MPVILMSGFDEKEVTDRFAGKDIAGFLKKPYTPDELHRQIERTMEKK